MAASQELEEQKAKFIRLKTVHSEGNKRPFHRRAQSSHLETATASMRGLSKT